MKHFIKLLAVIFCLLAVANPTNAQLLIKSNGNAEIGVDNFDPENPGIPQSYIHWLDTVTVLKIFGRYGDAAAGAHMTFGDTYLYNTYNVAVGELGYTDSDQLWLHGKAGTFVTAGPNALDTIMSYNPLVSTAVNFTKDVHTSGVEYEIEASGQVKLDAGFKVEQGARFAVLRSTYK